MSTLPEKHEYQIQTVKGRSRINKHIMQFILVLVILEMSAQD